MTNLPTLKNTLPNEHEMMVFHTMAEQAVTSKMYRGIGEKAGVMMIMLSAREMGISPMQALNGGLNIINGKVEISARMMSALIRKAGHQIIVKSNTDSECHLVGKRSDTGESQSAIFTIDDAQKAGLVKPGGGWIKWPKDMCFARALSRLARQLFSDVVGIGYVEGEIRATDAEISIPEDVSYEINNIEFDEKSELEKILNLFDNSEHEFVVKYLETVMKTFSWSKKKTIEEFQKEPNKLKEKFNLWKNKTKISDTPLSQ